MTSEAIGGQVLKGLMKFPDLNKIKAILFPRNIFFQVSNNEKKGRGSINAILFSYSVLWIRGN